MFDRSRFAVYLHHCGGIQHYLHLFRGREALVFTHSSIRKHLDFDDTSFLGLQSAPLEMVVFVDFESPYTTRVTSTIQSLVSDYTGLLKIYVKHNPLAFHSHGRIAALATIAASLQGRFVEYFLKISQFPRNLKEEDLFLYAKELNLNMARFRHDYGSVRAKGILERDMKEARTLGISGAPFFLLENYEVHGAVPYNEFRDKIVLQLTHALNVGK